MHGPCYDIDEMIHGGRSCAKQAQKRRARIVSDTFEAIISKNHRQSLETYFLNGNTVIFNQAATHLSIIVLECLVHALLVRGAIMEIHGANDALVSWSR